jgi:hypothetical protein
LRLAVGWVDQRWLVECIWQVPWCWFAQIIIADEMNDARMVLLQLICIGVLLNNLVPNSTLQAHHYKIKERNSLTNCFKIFEFAAFELC